MTTGVKKLLPAYRVPELRVHKSGVFLCGALAAMFFLANPSVSYGSVGDDAGVGDGSDRAYDGVVAKIVVDGNDLLIIVVNKSYIEKHVNGSFVTGSIKDEFGDIELVIFDSKGIEKKPKFHSLVRKKSLDYISLKPWGLAGKVVRGCDVARYYDLSPGKYRAKAVVKINHEIKDVDGKYVFRETNFVYFQVPHKYTSDECLLIRLK